MIRETRVVVPAIFTLTGGHCSIFLNVKRDVATCFPESPPGASAGLSVQPAMRRTDGTLSSPHLIDTTISVSRIRGGINVFLYPRTSLISWGHSVFSCGHLMNLMQIHPSCFTVCFLSELHKHKSCGSKSHPSVRTHLSLWRTNLETGSVAPYRHFALSRSWCFFYVNHLFFYHFFNGKFQTDMTLKPNAHDSLNTCSSEHVS